MDTCIIFCAGEFDRLVQPVDSTDLLLVADGGLMHTQKLGLIPDFILGDFDSLGYVPAGAQVFPVEKDDTDSMLAVRKGLELGYRRFVLYGALDGPRLDHTIANLQVLQFLADHGAAGYLVGKTHMVTVVRNGTLEFSGGEKGTLSVFCMGADAKGVTLQGLYYTMEKGCLSSGFPLGASNHFTGMPACIAVEQGSLLVLYDVTNGFPARSEGERLC